MDAEQLARGLARREIGRGKAVRVEAPNGLDRLTYDIDDNRTRGFSDDAFLRSQPAWEGDQLWEVPVSPGEFPVGVAARITGLDLRGYQDMRLVVTVGSPGGPVDAQLLWSFSLDGGGAWTLTLATVTLDEANHTLWGPWQPIPQALRQTIDAQLGLFGQGGDGSTQMRILEVALDIRGVDQTSAARRLPSKITPAEIADPVETELRSFSPADVAAIAGVGPGGSSPAFGTIAVAGQGSIVADAAPDTLTLVGSHGLCRRHRSRDGHRGLCARLRLRCQYHLPGRRRPARRRAHTDRARSEPQGRWRRLHQRH